MMCRKSKVIPEKPELTLEADQNQEVAQLDLSPEKKIIRDKIMYLSIRVFSNISNSHCYKTPTAFSPSFFHPSFYQVQSTRKAETTTSFGSPICSHFRLTTHINPLMTGHHTITIFPTTCNIHD